MAFKNYYDILGVSVSSTQDELKSAYRKLSMKFHPDKNNGDTFLAEMFKNINEANEVLSNLERKKEYDYTLKSFDEIHTPKASSNASTYSPVTQNVIDSMKSVNEYFKFYDIASQKYLEKSNAEYTPKPRAFTIAKALFSILVLLALWAFVRPKYSNSTSINWTTKQIETVYSKPNIKSRKIGVIGSGQQLEPKEETNYFIKIEFKDADSTVRTGYIRKKELKNNE